MNYISKSLLIFVIISTCLFGDDEGLNNYKNKKFEEAKIYYEQVIANTEENSAAVLGLGASQYQLGDIPTAAKSFEEALKSEDKEIQEKAYYNLGNAIYDQQRPQESIAFYRKALELNPNDDDAKFNYELAKYLVQEQQQDQNQENQDDQQNSQDQQSSDQNNQDNQPQDTDKDEPDKQDEQESDSSEQEQREAPKSQQQINAEAILDALKDEEQIHQKVKMAQQSGRKFEKDW